jgi:hypothetical protein
MFFELGSEAGSEFRGLRGQPGCGRLLQQLAIVLGATAGNAALLAALRQLPERIGARRLEESVAVSGIPDIDRHQRLSDEIGDVINRAGRVDRVVRHDDARAVEREAAGKDRETTEHRALGLREKTIAPIEGLHQRLMPPMSVPPPAGQQSEAVVEPSRNPLETDGRDLRGGKLDRQRKTVEPTTDLDDRRGAAIIEGECRIGGLSPPDEELHGAVLERPGSALAIALWHAQRGKLKAVLPIHSQWLPTGRQDMQARHAMQQHLCDLRHAVDHMLEVVEHEQQMLLPQDGRQLIGKARIDPESARDGSEDEPGIEERAQFDEPDAVGETRQRRSRDFETETRLADGAGTGEGQESVGGNLVRQGVELAVATHQERYRGGQICRFRDRDRHRSNRHRQPIAPSDVGLDHVPIGAQSFAQGTNLHVDVLRDHHRRRPDPFAQVFLGYDGTARFGESDQNIECPRAQLQGRVAGQQLPSLREQAERSEGEHRFRFADARRRGRDDDRGIGSLMLELHRLVRQSSRLPLSAP